MGARCLFAVTKRRSPTPSLHTPLAESSPQRSVLEGIAEALFPQTHFVGGGKISRDFLCHLACGGPLSSALERRDKAHAFLRRKIFAVVVAERRMEDAAFAILNDHQHRFHFAR